MSNNVTLDHPNDNGFTALSLTTYYDNINMNILRLLGDNGADVNIKEATWGYSALMWAAKANNY